MNQLPSHWEGEDPTLKQEITRELHYLGLCLVALIEGLSLIDLWWPFGGKDPDEA